MVLGAEATACSRRAPGRRPPRYGAGFPLLQLRRPGRGRVHAHGGRAQFVGNLHTRTSQFTSTSWSARPKSVPTDSDETLTLLAASAFFSAATPFGEDSS